jgi:hypothetical protein
LIHQSFTHAVKRVQVNLLSDLCGDEMLLPASVVQLRFTKQANWGLAMKPRLLMLDKVRFDTADEAR